MTHRVASELSDDRLDERAARLNGKPSLSVTGSRARLEPEPEPIVPPEFSDDALALAFADTYSDSLKYTAAWGKWYERDGPRWKEDSTLVVFDKARQLCRGKAIAAKKSVRSMIASARTVANVERFARADRRHVATPEQWDADPWLLCTPSGVVDLRTGELRGARSDEYLTKITAVGPGGKCPRWLELLDWATGGDSETFDYLQRVFGYGLTGSIREHALFFCYGVGGNGKGTTLNTVADIMGDYAEVAPSDAFTEHKGDRHPTDLAMLRGARLVTAQEVERGRKWNEQRIKSITGGDPISARFMRQDFFTFKPEFKLIVAGNHKPAIDSVDDAMRRRFHLIPFNQKISAQDVDDMLPEKLREEWPGILAWMIDGCLAWQEQGLRPSVQVTAATAEYLNGQDSYEAWLSEACTRGPREWDSSANLYASWSAFARRSGEEAGKMKGFVQELQKKGFTLKMSGHSNTRGMLGLSVRSDTANAYLSSR